MRGRYSTNSGYAPPIRSQLGAPSPKQKPLRVRELKIRRSEAHVDDLPKNVASPFITGRTPSETKNVEDLA